MTAGAHTAAEIASQPQAWRAALRAFASVRPALESFLARLDFEQVIVIGCGSTYYLAQSVAATLAGRLGGVARALPSSELWLLPNTLSKPAQTLLLAVSRSGTTTETLRALARFRQASAGATLAITCDPDSPLARQADFALVAAEAQERSVAQTRSFTSMLLLAQALTPVLTGDRRAVERLQHLPDALDDLLTRLGDLPERLAGDLSIERFFFLGSGPLYGLACEAMLKVKEMSLSNAEAYHPLELRHGPMALVDDHALVVGLLSDSAATEEQRVLEDMRRLGARTLALVESAAMLRGHPADEVVELRSGLEEWERGPLFLPPLQRLAFHRALAKGLDPDRPRNLTAVVEL